MRPLVFPDVPRPRVSIVMVTYGGWEWVRKSLEAILANTDACYELIVVDNASPDGLGDRLEQEVFHARIVRNSTNRGFGCASNQGADFAVGEILAFLNSDAFVHPGWLPPLLERFDADLDAAAVAPRLLNTDGSLQEAGSVVFENGHTQFVGFGDDPARPEYRFPRSVDYASGACLLVRRADFFEVGGFDPIYAPAYFEDVDLCLALRSRGRRIVYEPRSAVTHVRGASWGKETGVEHWTRNAPVFAQRWARLLASRPAATAAEGLLRRRIAARDAPASARILIAADRFTSFPGSGRPGRPAWLATELADLYPDAQVTLLCGGECGPSPEREELLERGIEVAAEQDWSYWLRARRFHYDVILMAGPSAVDRFEVLLDTQPQAFLVADAAAFPGGIPKSGRSLRRRTSRARELEALTSADVALFASSSDLAWARSLRRPESCFLVPGPVESGNTPAGFWARTSIVFIASEEATSAVNQNALAYFGERILPLVKEADPGIEITVAASLSGEVRRRLERENVRIVPPGRATEHLERARVLIAPFPRRPPTSDFLLRAAALGLPFVATPGAAAGLPFEDIPPDAVVKTAREMAHRVLALHRDEVRWTRLQRALRRRALRSVEPDSVRETLVRAFARVGLAPPAVSPSVGSRRKESARRR